MLVIFSFPSGRKIETVNMNFGKRLSWIFYFTLFYSYRKLTCWNMLSEIFLVCFKYHNLNNYHEYNFYGCQSFVI